MPPLHCESLPPRDCPTVLRLDFAAEWWTPPRREVAEAVAADLSAKVDAPGWTDWQVRLDYDPATPVIAYATGISGRGYVYVGPAAEAHDLATVLRHELVHTLGVMEHSDDPRAVMWYSLAPDEVRHWRASDDALLRAGGLIVVQPAEPDPPPTAPRPPDEVYPYSESHPYRGPLVAVPFGSYGGWALVPPRVAAEWEQLAA